MGTQLSRQREAVPSMFNDFFRPGNEWFDNGGFMGRTLLMQAVNISEAKDNYLVSLAVPGVKKDDFKVDVEGNMITSSSEKSETTEANEEKYTRKEYNYSSFSRSFTI